MTIKLSQKIEVLANVMIVLIAFLTVGVVVQRYFFAKSELSPQTKLEPVVGKTLNLLNEDFSANPKTIVLALQTTCHFCNESMSFYKRLIEETKDKNVKIVAVFPQNVEESIKHLKEFGITEIEVKQSSPSTLSISSSPTLILTNQKGEIMDYWVGKLPPEKEEEVISKVNS